MPRLFRTWVDFKVRKEYALKELRPAHWESTSVPRTRRERTTNLWKTRPDLFSSRLNHRKRVPVVLKPHLRLRWEGLHGLQLFGCAYFDNCFFLALLAGLSKPLKNRSWVGEYSLSRSTCKLVKSNRKAKSTQTINLLTEWVLVKSY